MEKKQSFEALIQSPTPTLIDFYAEWCGPCKMMNPILKDLAQEIGESGRIVKIDIDKNRQLTQQLGIQGVPTFMMAKDGKILWRQSGMIGKSQLKQVFEHFNQEVA